MWCPFTFWTGVREWTPYPLRSPSLRPLFEDWFRFADPHSHEILKLFARVLRIVDLKRYRKDSYWRFRPAATPLLPSLLLCMPWAVPSSVTNFHHLSICLCQHMEYDISSDPPVITPEDYQPTHQDLLEINRNFKEILVRCVCTDLLQWIKEGLWFGGSSQCICACTINFQCFAVWVVRQSVHQSREMCATLPQATRVQWAPDGTCFIDRMWRQEIECKWGARERIATWVSACIFVWWCICFVTGHLAMRCDCVLRKTI